MPTVREICPPGALRILFRLILPQILCSNDLECVLQLRGLRSATEVIPES